jgi:nicotinamidase-related amidase
MPKKALIIIDMLNDFIDEKGALFLGKDARNIIPFIKKRIDIYRKNSYLLLYLKDSHAENDKEFARFPRHCITGTWGSNIIKELKPEPGETIIPKNRYSGFFNTDLSVILEKEKVENIEVVGVCTSICIMDTVGGLVNRDYRVSVPAKGVADFDQEFHEFALKRMDKVYGVTILK